MNEAKYELKNWIKWKRTIELLEDTKQQTMDMRKAIPFTGNNEMPGGNHQSIHEKLGRIIDDCEQYDLIIKDYKFLVNRLEKAINTLLSEDEKRVVTLYANNPDNVYKREMRAHEQGYSRKTYYSILNQATATLNIVLLQDWKQKGNKKDNK